MQRQFWEGRPTAQEAGGRLLDSDPRPNEMNRMRAALSTGCAVDVVETVNAYLDFVAEADGDSIDLRPILQVRTTVGSVSASAEFRARSRPRTDFLRTTR